VQVGGSDRATTFVSDSQLTAQIPASDLAAGGTRQVAVVNPVPGGGVSNLASFTVTSYTLGATPMSQTVSAGQSASYNLTVAPQQGAFNAPVSFACSGLPGRTSCSFSPSSVTPGSNPASAMLTIATTAPSTAQAPPPSGALYALWLGLLGLALLPAATARRRPRRGRAAATALTALLLLLALLAACGGSTEVRVVSRPGTPPGSHTVTVTATSGSFQQSTVVTLVVQ
jgi:hypothetical protein